MRSFLFTAFLAVVCIAAMSIARADVPQPRPDPSKPKPHENTLRLVIEGGENPEPQIWLPPELRVEASAAGAPTPTLPTVAAGVALSLSLVFGGMWLVRMRRRIGWGPTAGAASILCVLAGTAIVALANAAPPRNYRPVDPGSLGQAAPAGDALSGRARYYYGADDGVVRIVLPRKRAS